MPSLQTLPADHAAANHSAHRLPYGPPRPRPHPAADPARMAEQLAYYQAQVAELQAAETQRASLAQEFEFRVSNNELTLHYPQASDLTAEQIAEGKSRKTALDLWTTAGAHVPFTVRDFGKHAGHTKVSQTMALCIALIGKQVKNLRDMSPLWDMKMEGIDIATIEWAQH